MFETLKRIADKRLHGEHSHDETTVDSDLPAHIKIGLPVQLSSARLAAIADTLIKGPGMGMHTIVSVSKLNVQGSDVDGQSIYRLFLKLERGDDQEGGKTAFVEVLNDHDQIVEATYFESLTRSFPSTTEEIEAFTGNGFGLGETDFALSKEQLSGAGVPDSLLSRIALEEDQLWFKREIPGADYIKPIVAKETRIDEATGMKGQASDLMLMGYARSLSGGEIERLLVQFTEVKTIDGQPANDVHVDCYVGIKLPDSSFKVVG